MSDSLNLSLIHSCITNRLPESFQRSGLFLLSSLREQGKAQTAKSNSHHIRSQNIDGCISESLGNQQVQGFKPEAGESRKATKETDHDRLMNDDWHSIGFEIASKATY